MNSPSLSALPLVLVLALAAPAAAPASLSAQEGAGTPGSDAPFSRLRIRTSAGAGGLDGTTATYWDAGREWSIEAAGSFHGGRLAAQADRTTFRGREPGLPAVTGTHLWVGWLRGLALPLRLEAEAGGFLGGLWMEDDEGVMGEPEAEMAVAAQLALAGPRLGPVRPFVRGRLRRVFFERPLDLASASAGLEWSGGLPPEVSSALGGEGAAPDEGSGARPPAPAARGAALTTLTRADLDRAGVTRWEDLYRLLPGWRAASVDRYAWNLAAPGGGQFDDPHPKVLVDGIPVPVSVLGVAGLEHLPVSPADVDSVQVLERPLLEAGEPVPGGLLHFHTRRLRGLEAGASHQEGNPAGDPGLLGLTPLGTGNVERIGRYTTYRAGAGREGGGAWIGRANLTRYHTNGPDRHRIAATRAPVDANPYIQTLRTGGGGVLEGAAGRVRLLAGATRTDDFFFLPVVGTEVVTRNDHDFAGLAGRLRLPGAGALRLRGFLDRRTLRPHDFDPRPGFGFRRDRVGGTVAWEAGEGGPEAGSDAGAAVGLHYDLRRVEASGVGPARRDLHRARAFGRLALPGRVRIDASLSRVGGAWGGAAVAARSWRPVEGARVTAHLAVAAEPFEEADGFAVWWLRGYRIPARPELGLDVEGAAGAGGAPGARRTLVADLRGGQCLAAGRLRLDGGAWVRRASGLALAAPRFRVAAGLPELLDPGAVPLRTDQRGAVAGVWARAGGSPAPGWSGGVAVFGDALLSGSDGFREARREVPAGRASAWLLWSGLPDLTLRAAVRRSGPSRWAAYDVAGSDVGGRVPGRTAVELAVQKWVWGGRLRGLILLRDLLDQGRPLQPIGIVPGARMFVRAEVRLGGR